MMPLSFDHQQIRFAALGARAHAFGRGLFGAWLLVGAIVFSLDNARAEDEVAKFHLFGGGGFKRLALTTDSSSTRANFSGWGATGELGMRVPFSRKFGFGLAAVYAQSDTMNSDRAGTFMESGYLQSIGGRGGFYIGRFEFGGGSEQLKLVLNNVSSGQQGSSVVKNGTGSYGYVNLNFDYQRFLRTVIEFKYETGELDQVQATEISGSLKILFLLGAG